MRTLSIIFFIFLISINQISHSKQEVQNNKEIHKLIKAINNGDSTKADAIINSKTININTQDSDGLTPLHFACINGMTNIIQHLIDKGANVNITTKENNTALIYAALHRDLNIIKILINNSADPMIKNIDGMTAMDISKKLNDTKSYEYMKNAINNKALIQNGNNNNITENNNKLQKIHKNHSNKHYYMIHLGAFVDKKDAINYINIMKSNHPWLKNLHYEISKEYINKTNHTFYNLFAGLFANKEDADNVKNALLKSNVHTKVLSAKTSTTTLKKINFQDIKNDINEINQKEAIHNTSHDHKYKKFYTIDNLKNCNHDNEQYSKYYILDFGIFIDKKHAEEYWNKVKRIKWMSSLSSIYPIAIHENIDGAIVSLQAGALVEHDLAFNMAEILSKANNIRTEIKVVYYLPDGLHIVKKDKIFKTFNYSDYYTHKKEHKHKTIKPKHEKHTKHKKLDVREAIPFTEEQTEPSALPESTKIRVSSYRNKYTAIKNIAKASKMFEIEDYSIRLDPMKKAIIYMSVSSVSANAVCNYFIETGYNCTVFENNAN